MATGSADSVSTMQIGQRAADIVQSSSLAPECRFFSHIVGLRRCEDFAVQFHVALRAAAGKDGSAPCQHDNIT